MADNTGDRKTAAALLLLLEGFVLDSMIGTVGTRGVTCQKVMGCEKKSFRTLVVSRASLIDDGQKQDAERLMPAPTIILCFFVLGGGVVLSQKEGGI